MVPPPAEVVRSRSRLTAPAVALLALARKAVRKRPREAALLAALVLVVGALGGGYAYARYHWRATRAAVKEGRPEEARGRLRVWLLLFPRSVEVHLQAARAARLGGDFDTAEAHLNRCLELRHGATEPVQVEFLLMRVQRGEVDEVVSELFQYVDNDSPEAPLILETLARAYMRDLRYGPAYTCLTRWVAAAPDSATPHHWRGWVLEKLNNYEGAMEDYRRALELDPDLTAARLRLAELYLRKSNPPEAAAHLERLSPDRPEVMARLGQCRFLQGRHEEARRLLEAAVEELPNDSDALLYLAKLDLQEDRPARAERWLRRALKVDPTDTEAQFTLAACLQSQRRWKEARAVLEKHRKDSALLKRVAKVLQEEGENPSADPDTLSELGALFLRNNERVGLYWLHRALQRDPGHEPTHKVLAEYYEGKGRPESAAAHRRWLSKPRGKAGSP
jgi:tetratricopeptide (TPR) repeat protein